MEKTSIPRLLLKLAPPVMLSLLIQSIYNLVDSIFIGRYSDAGLTALSIIYPIQLLLTALATGIGTGAGILVSHADGSGKKGCQGDIAVSALTISIGHAVIVTICGLALLDSFLGLSSQQEVVRQCGLDYGRIVLLFSLGCFIQAILEKLLQTKGKMTVPMIAQIAGTICNIILDPILIFGLGGAPEMGLKGAAIATVCGQWRCMLITLAGFLVQYPKEQRRGRISPTIIREIYRTSAASILMQSLYTLYIIGLNLILKGFTEDAVTVLGIYYKLQTFFFIPLIGLQQVILPVISHNYGAGKGSRIREVIRYSSGFSICIMVLATAAFIIFPRQLTGIFTTSESVCTIGAQALPIISLSFLPAAVNMMLIVCFQGIMMGKWSICITLLRQVFLLVPLAWLFHFGGLGMVWLTFPVTEIITLGCAVFLYQKYATTAMGLTAPTADLTA